MPLVSLPLFHRIAGSRVVVLGEGEAADAKRRLVERAGGICVGEPEAHHARLAFVAMDDPKAAEAAAIRLRCKGLLVNVTDTPALCDFTVPSIVDRDPVLIAVGTGGVSAGLAKMLRLRIERILPQGLGRLAQMLGAAKGAIRDRWPTGDARRRALDAALGEGGEIDVLVEHDEDAVNRWLRGEGKSATTGVHEIVLRSCDPEELTMRDARLLGSADVVMHDVNVAEAILVRARADARRVSPVDENLPDEPSGLIVVIRLR